MAAVMATHIRRGAYVLADAADAQAIILSTGSELELAVTAKALLSSEGIAVRVVSMPCSNVFDRQSASYQESVLPPALPAVAIEAAHPDFWRKYVGRTGVVIGMATFGESAPAAALYEHFGITTQRLVEAVRSVVRGTQP